MADIVRNFFPAVSVSAYHRYRGPRHGLHNVQQRIVTMMIIVIIARLSPIWQLAMTIDSPSSGATMADVSPERVRVDIFIPPPDPRRHRRRRRPARRQSSAETQRHR